MHFLGRHFFAEHTDHSLGSLGTVAWLASATNGQLSGLEDTNTSSM